MAFPNPFKREPTVNPSPTEPRVEPSFGGSGPAAPTTDDSPWAMAPDDARFATPRDDNRYSAAPQPSAPASMAGDVPSIDRQEPRMNFGGEARQEVRYDGMQGMRADPRPTEAPAPEAVASAPKKSFFSGWKNPFVKKKTDAAGATPEGQPAQPAPEAQPQPMPSREPLTRQSFRTTSADAAANPQRAAISTDQALIARQKTRNRLVGAAALLMAAVIIAPLFLDSEKALDGPKVSTNIPPVTESQRVEVPIDAAPAKTDTADANANNANGNVKEEELQDNNQPASTPQAGGAVARVNVPPQAAPAPAPVQQAAPAQQPDAAARAQAAVAAQKAKAERAAAEERQKAQQAKAAEKADSKADAAAANAKGYFVQVLAIGNEGKADAAVKRMRDHGLPAYKMKVQGRNLWRVRVGPFKTRDQAMSAIGKLTLIGYTEKLAPEQQ